MIGSVAPPFPGRLKRQRKVIRDPARKPAASAAHDERRKGFGRFAVCRAGSRIGFRFASPVRERVAHQPAELINWIWYQVTFTRQISSAYSRIERSDENHAIRDVFRMADFHQAFGLPQAVSISRWARQ